jgi:hypothetical protein
MVEVDPLKDAVFQATVHLLLPHKLLNLRPLNPQPAAPAKAEDWRAMVAYAL